MIKNGVREEIRTWVVAWPVVAAPVVRVRVATSVVACIALQYTDAMSPGPFNAQYEGLAGEPFVREYQRVQEELCPTLQSAMQWNEQQQSDSPPPPQLLLLLLLLMMIALEPGATLLLLLLLLFTAHHKTSPLRSLVTKCSAEALKEHAHVNYTVREIRQPWHYKF